MIGVFKNKPLIIAAIVTGLTAIVFVTQAFSTPEGTESSRILQYVLSLDENDVGTYTAPTYGFSIAGLPADFVSPDGPEDPDGVIIVKHPTFHLGLEVFISDVEEEEPLTADAIRQAIPSLSVIET